MINKIKYLILFALLTSCEKRIPLQPSNFITVDKLKGDWLITESEGTKSWRAIIIRDSTFKIITRSHDPRTNHFTKIYGIRNRDSTIIDKEHPYGNGLLKVLEFDGYKMTAKTGSWKFKMRKLFVD